MSPNIQIQEHLTRHYFVTKIFLFNISLLLLHHLKKVILLEDLTKIISVKKDMTYFRLLLLLRQDFMSNLIWWEILTCKSDISILTCKSDISILTCKSNISILIPPNPLHEVLETNTSEP